MGCLDRSSWPILIATEQFKVLLVHCLKLSKNLRCILVAANSVEDFLYFAVFKTTTKPVPVFE
jgi:hypothetical protein